jgi:hypothetical protein
VADCLEWAFVNIQGEGEQKVAVRSERHQGLDEAPEQIQVHSANPDAAQADGSAQIVKRVQLAGINSDEKQQGKENEEAHGPIIVHGVPPGKKSLRNQEFFLPGIIN